MAGMTKGAQRRNAYISAAIEATALTASIMYAWPWWAVLIITLFFMGSVRELAALGFTSKANNEE